MRVPNRDYPAIAAGTKTEFRQPHIGALLVNSLTELPIPIVAFAQATPASGFTGAIASRSCLLVCERFWQEPLGAISPASIEAEGFSSPKEFRGYWRRRFKHGRFDRYQLVRCFQVRPYRPEDEQPLKDALYDRFILRPFREIRADQQS